VGVNGLLRQQALAQEAEQRLPVFLPHEDEREVLDLARLDERGRLEDLVERTLRRGPATNLANARPVAAPESRGTIGTGPARDFPRR
jgi:hypothetical protein